MIDTIVAVSTSFVPSAIGLIRLSGSKVLEISELVLSRNEKFFSKEFLKENKRSSIYCDFVDRDNKLDQILYTYFESPNSYTGEDLAEFSFHGNPILLRNCLEVFFRLGARPAKEGEFTKRAFLNQKLDLSKAEAIGRFISARSNLELELAKKNVYGEISRLSSRLRSDLISLKAECEAEIDFSTEDLTYESLEERKSRMMNVIKLCSNTLEHSQRADTAIEETSVVIYGEPNSGKSSLLNMMLGKERAIVSDIPGTTRDFLKESLNLGGIPIQLIDTAGVRETEDTVEKLGIERSKSEFSKAKIKLFLFDASLEYDIENFINLHKEKLEHSVLLANKIDIGNPNFAEYKKKLLPFVIDSLEISCKERKGITELVQLISDKIQTETTKEDFIFLEDRNKFHFQSILSSLQKSVELLENSAPAEIYIKEIDYALASVGEINGRVETEEVLGRIFSKFCVGK